MGDVPCLYAVKVHFDLPIHTFNKLYYLLPRQRQAKVNFYTYYHDKVRALFTGLLLKYCLGYFGVNQLKFVHNQYGKPYIPECPIQFNLSHSGDWVVCALSDQVVGVDIEECKPLDYEKLAPFLLHNKQYEAWVVKPNHLRQTYFYYLWTIKESVVKATGKGLALDMCHLFIENMIDNVHLCRVQGIAQTWFCKNYTISSNYQISLCLPTNTFPSKVKKLYLQDICMLNKAGSL